MLRKYDWEDLGWVIGVAVVMAVGYAAYSAFSFDWLLGSVFWCIEVCAYPFWLIFTKLLRVDISQFESFWCVVGIVLLFRWTFGRVKIGSAL